MGGSTVPAATAAPPRCASTDTSLPSKRNSAAASVPAMSRSASQAASAIAPAAQSRRAHPAVRHHGTFSPRALYRFAHVAWPRSWAQPCHELVRVDRLGDVVVHARPYTDHAFLDLALASRGSPAGPGVRLSAARRALPGRSCPACGCQVPPPTQVLGDPRHPAGPVVRFLHLEPGSCQRPDEEAPNRVVVVDQQHSLSPTRLLGIEHLADPLGEVDGAERLGQEIDPARAGRRARSPSRCTPDVQNSQPGPPRPQPIRHLDATQLRQHDVAHEQVDRSATPVCTFNASRPSDATSTS